MLHIRLWQALRWEETGQSAGETDRHPEVSHRHAHERGKRKPARAGAEFTSTVTVTPEALMSYMNVE